MRLRNPLAAAALAAACSLSVGACAAEDDAPTRVTINVYAAASLSEVFAALAEQYETAHPGVSIRLTFAGSSDLAAQINEGAPADIFASANEAQMGVVAEHVAGMAELFASNTLTIAVPRGNPGGVTDFASLANPGLKVVVCAPEVPCGAATALVEEKLGVILSPVSELTNVTDVLGAVSSGEADAGLVYVTDVARAKEVEGIPFAGSASVATRYPIAVLTGAHAPTAARSFVDFVLGQQGQAALLAAGFATSDGGASDVTALNGTAPDVTAPDASAVG